MFRSCSLSLVIGYLSHDTTCILVQLTVIPRYYHICNGACFFTLIILICWQLKVNWSCSPPGSSSADSCELQLEYWVPNKSGDKSKTSLSKETLKGVFKYIQVIREKTSFRLIAVTREKRGKSKWRYSNVSFTRLASRSLIALCFFSI